MIYGLFPNAVSTPSRDKDVVSDKKTKEEKTKLIYDHFPNAISTPLRDKDIVNGKKEKKKGVQPNKKKAEIRPLSQCYLNSSERQKRSQRQKNKKTNIYDQTKKNKRIDKD